MSEADGKKMSRSLATSLALGAYVVPYALSRSTSPSPDHPRILLWYKLLRQPFFKPPDIAIPVTWVALETGLALAAYRLLRKPASHRRTVSLSLLAGNVAAVGGWSRLFFGSRNLPLSTVAAAAMVVTGAAYAVEARPLDKPAAAAGIALTGWVAFAAVLTAAIWHKNR